LIKLAISRQREYLADASSASITDPNGMISALRKLDTHVRPMRQQNVAAEALFIAGPLKKSFISRLFSTHPPMEARIERLENAKK
jgi:heat shock protein HtpX